MRRILLYIIVVPIVLVVVAALLIPLLVDDKQLFELASNALEKQTGASLTVNGESKFSLLPRIALKMKDVELTLPGPGQPDLSARSLKVGVRLLPLLSRNVEIKSLGLHGLLINIPPGPKESRADTSQLSNAELDAFYAKRRQLLAEAGARQDEAGAALALPLALEVNEFSLTKSRIVLLAEGNEPDTIIDIHALEADHLNLAGKPFPLQLSLAVAGEESSQPIELNLDSTLTANLKNSALKIDALSATINGATAEPIELSAEGDIDLQRSITALTLAITAGDNEGNGKLRFASYESPQIDTELHFKQFDPALFVLADPEASSEVSGASSKPGDDLPLGALRGMDTRARITIEEALYKRHRLSDISLQLRVVDGVARLAPVTAAGYGGRLSMQAVLNAKQNTVKLSSEGELTDLQVPALLDALEAEPQLSGQASASWQLAGSGRTSQALSKSLQGPIKLRTDSIVLKSMGVERMLCKAVALVNREQLSTELPRQTAFDDLSIDVDVADGRAKLNPLSAKLPHIALSGKGDLDLETLHFDARFDAALSPSLSEVDQACRVNERLTAIQWPVVCDGSLEDDAGKWCKVDSSNIIEDLAKNEVRRKVEEKAGDLFNKVFGGNKDD